MASKPIDILLALIVMAFVGIVAKYLLPTILAKKGTARKPAPVGAPSKVVTGFPGLSSRLTGLILGQEKLLAEAKTHFSLEALTELNELYTQAHFSSDSLGEMISRITQGKENSKLLYDEVKLQENAISAILIDLHTQDTLKIKTRVAAASYLSESNQKLAIVAGSALDMYGLLGEKFGKIAERGAEAIHEYLRAGNLERGTSYADSKKQNLQSQILESLEESEKLLQSSKSESEKASL